MTVPSASVPRSRVALLLTLPVVLVAGICSRRFGAALPGFVREYAGDTLWAVAAYTAIALLFPRWSVLRLATATLLFAYAIELSQLYHAPWIDSIRATALGGLVLGFGFLWSDIACYTA